MKIIKSKHFGALVVMMVGVVAFAGIVMADDVATSVTVGNASPSVTVALEPGSAVSGGDVVTLSEGSFVWATATVIATDTNGCGTISSVTAKMYLASTSNNGTNCSQNDNNCYVGVCTATTTGNQCDGDTSVGYDCGFKLWYIAEGTAGDGDWLSSIWSIAATATDSSAATGYATNSAETAEINGLRALDAGPAIDYSSLSIGQTSSEIHTYATNTGNVVIDVSLQATDDMCSDYPTCSANYILSTQQEYSLTQGFTYTAGTDLSSTSPGSLNTSIVNPTSTTSPSIDDIYWLLQIPNGTANTSYTGINVFTAIAPI